MKAPGKPPAVVVTACALLATGTALLSGCFAPIQLLDVRVLDATDPTRSDRITELAVEVHNPGPADLWPNFAIPGGALKNWYSWTVVDGPIPLAAGRTATYHLSQPPYTGIPINEGFRVVVNDIRDTSIRGASPVTRAEVDWALPAVLNPDFEAWEHSMFHATPLPYGWVHWFELHRDDKYAISGADGTVTLTLDPDQSRVNGTQWSLVSMRQRIDFPTRLHIELVEATRGAFAAGARTQAGVWLEDVHGGTQVVVLFTDHATDADQAATVDLDFGPVASHRILVTNRSIDVDLLAIYKEHGWHLPERQALPRLVPNGPGDVGMGHASVMAGLERAEIVRPMELKVFVASYPPHEREHIEATFSFVGGPADEPAPSRVL